MASRQRRFLVDDEDLVIDAPLHWWPLVRPISGALVVLGACVAGFVLWRRAPLWFAWVLLGVFFVEALVVGSRVAAHRGTRLVVTTDRIVLRAGVLRRHRREIPLARLREVGVTQRFGQRLIGSGDLLLDFGAEAGPDRVLGVRHPAALYEQINTARRAAQRRAPAATPAGLPEAALIEVGEPGAREMLDPRVRDTTEPRARLERLHAAGVISAVELAEKCAELDAVDRPRCFEQGAVERLL